MSKQLDTQSVAKLLARLEGIIRAYNASIERFHRQYSDNPRLLKLASLLASKLALDHINSMGLTSADGRDKQDSEQPLQLEEFTVEVQTQLEQDSSATTTGGETTAKWFAVIGIVAIFAFAIGFVFRDNGVLSFSEDRPPTLSAQSSSPPQNPSIRGPVIIHHTPCQAEVSFSLEGFAPNSQVTVASEYSETSCETGVYTHASWGLVYGRTDDDGSLVYSGKHFGIGSYFYTFSDEAGNTISSTFFTSQLRVPSYDENGVTYTCPETGDYIITIVDGVYSPWPSTTRTEDNPQWRTYLTVYVNNDVYWGIVDEIYQPVPVGTNDKFIGNLEIPYESRWEATRRGKGWQRTVFCEQSQYLRFVARDERGRHFDNEGHIWLSIQLSSDLG